MKMIREYGGNIMYVEGEEFRIKAEVKKVRFRDPHNGYRVLEIEIIEQESINSSENHLSTNEVLIGSMLEVKVGFNIDCLVRVTKHHIYGYQLRLKEYLSGSNNFPQIYKDNIISLGKRSSSRSNYGANYYTDFDPKIEHYETVNDAHSLSKILEALSDFHSPHIDCCVIAQEIHGDLGMNKLNVEIQNIINPWDKTKRQLRIFDVKEKYFREGDPVVNLEDDKEVDVEKGALGIITKVHKKQHTNPSGQTCTFHAIEVTYQKGIMKDKIIEYSEFNLHKLDLAYALTPGLIGDKIFKVVIASIVYDTDGYAEYCIEAYNAKYNASEIILYVGNVYGLLDQLDLMVAYDTY